MNWFCKTWFIKIYQQYHSDIEGDVTPILLQYRNAHKRYHHACFVVMWIKQLSVSKDELPIDLKISITAEVSNRKVFSNGSAFSWCNWNIPSLTSPSLLLISLNISHIIGPDTVHFNNASLLSKNPMAPPSTFSNLLFCSTYCPIYSNVKEIFFCSFSLQNSLYKNINVLMST